MEVLLEKNKKINTSDEFKINENGVGLCRAYRKPLLIADNIVRRLSVWFFSFEF
jgi:hypothetical protein